MPIKQNCARRGCKDVFNASLVSSSIYEGLLDYPVIKPNKSIPNRLIAFSKAISSQDYDQWVHFFEDDCHFERIWRSPKKYLPMLRRFNGIILPDFSVYRDMPLVMQLWNIYRSRAIGAGHQANGGDTIANIRYGDWRTLSFCCDGVPKHSAIAVGTHGTLRDKEDRFHFVEGLDVIGCKLEPSNIVVYGSAPDCIFDRYREQGIGIISFESDIAKAHRMR